MPRPAPHKLDHRPNISLGPLEHRLHTAVRAVARPPRHTPARRLATHGVAEEHSLDPPRGRHPPADRILAHAQYRNPMASIEVLDISLGEATQASGGSLALVAFGTGVGRFPLERVVFAAHDEQARGAFEAALA